MRIKKEKEEKSLRKEELNKRLQLLENELEVTMEKLNSESIKDGSPEYIALTNHVETISKAISDLEKNRNDFNKTVIDNSVKAAGIMVVAVMTAVGFLYDSGHVVKSQTLKNLLKTFTIRM